MSYSQRPPPYSEAPYVNTQGPLQYVGGPPYMDPRYGGGAPVIIVQQSQSMQPVVVRSSGTSHGLCCLICVLTGGLNLPCWIWSCITD